MTGRVQSVSGHQRLPITTWRVCATPAGALEGPQALDGAALAWIEAAAPTTAAAALRAAGAFSFDGPARRFDAEDWWFRAPLPAVERNDADELALSFGGLATVADVWLDGVHLFTSENMFAPREQRLDGAAGGELVIRCRALDPLLARKRPRPRWRAPMIENQQLRWYRTTLLGRTPGWSPPAAAVGPWRPVVLERRVGVAVDDVRLRAALNGQVGRVEVSCRVRALGRGPLGPITLVVERAGEQHRVALEAAGEQLSGRLELRDPARWWPHTHGEPARYHARLEIGGAPPIEVALGAIGFREVVRHDEFELRINGAPIFCRGACWTPLDPVALGADRAAYAVALLQAQRAGMNLLRVGGTMVYESDDFYDLCDELGILVWQDFMFANMDYPEDDAAFVAGVVDEARQLLQRLQARPSVAVLCGSSEGEQQAAMWGATRERWSPRLFHEVLPSLVEELCPGVPYWPSSAHGGDFPHQANAGTTSYYGVGAYLRPLTDARRAEVRFASECLAFANVPEPRALPGGPSVRVHHPAWKARTPRDLGAGWDFDDVRDHYLAELFAVEPMRLRYADHERYLALGRVVTGEVMAQVFGEWRSSRSTCRGGVVWFLRDLWPSAGWGVVDASGAPKAAWFYLRRALQPVAIHVSDEGGNGLALHLVNERPDALAGEVELTLFHAGEVKVASARRAVTLAPRQPIELGAASFFDGFIDLSYAYRFGPPSHDLVVATLFAASGELQAQAFHFPLGLSAARELDVGLSAEARLDGDGALVTLRTRRFAQSIAVDAEGFEPDDAYFHLPPGGERTLRLRRVSGTASLRGTLQPLNSAAVTKIVVS
ncbi:MAG: beta-mannosidase [Myxococcales bacterium]|nr:beta-mannosidase [Myxococcales bacterium]